jgi:hypothetical protein
MFINLAIASKGLNGRCMCLANFEKKKKCLEKGLESLLVLRYLPKSSNYFQRINWEVYVLGEGFESSL